MSRWKTVSAFLFVLSICLPRIASADAIIFDSLGPGSTFSATNAYIFGYEFENDEGVPQTVNWRAMPFVAQQTATLGTITAPIQFDQVAPDRGPGALQLVLYANDNGLPGQALETFTRDGSAPPRSLLSFTSTARPQLIAGTPYFLAAQTLGFAEGEWWGGFEPEGQWSTPFQSGPDFELGAWRPGQSRFRTAFKVTGDPAVAATPEPASGLLILGGALGLLRKSRTRRRRQGPGPACEC